MAVSYKRICDARCHTFYRETFKKENFLRMKWFLRNQDQLLKNLDGHPEAKRPTPPIKAESSDRQKSIWRGSIPSWRPPATDGSIDMHSMKPIDSKVLDILYEKEVPSFITAEQYFHERLQQKPENRYYFPECSTWIYGWRLGDYPSVPSSKVKRKGVIRTEFYHPKVSSLSRKPEWHRDCRRRNVKSCKM